LNKNTLFFSIWQGVQRRMQVLRREMQGEYKVSLPESRGNSGRDL